MRQSFSDPDLCMVHSYFRMRIRQELVQTIDVCKQLATDFFTWVVYVLTHTEATHPLLARVLSQANILAAKRHAIHRHWPKLLQTWLILW